MKPVNKRISRKHQGFRTASIAIAVASMLLTLVTTEIALAQEPNAKEPIKVEKKFGGYKFTYRGVEIKKASELKPIVSDYPDTAAAAKRSGSYNSGATVLAGVGGLLIGWPIGEAIAGKDDPKWVLAGAGAGLATVGMVLAMQSVRHAKTAVDIYNVNIGQTRKGPLGLRLVVAPRGVSVLFRF